MEDGLENDAAGGGDAPKGMQEESESNITHWRVEDVQVGRRSNSSVSCCLPHPWEASIRWMSATPPFSRARATGRRRKHLALDQDPPPGRWIEQVERH
ncbi:hypothetical protein E2562_019362 [Oryza meyeriana var. granulata]|uniref:Uncharacterized protein n=1 Tax=Oryza meyeriana var. granulata TaxID=110450 RepID=A0A6G1BM30_9ORYZ|nr:hypothetical protein E2562_019362 [Oryza meyeriana var. granulata]